MVEGSIESADGAWHFRYPAFTCDESVYLGRWLLQFGEWANGDLALARGRLSFTEPNLQFAVEGKPGSEVVLRVEFALECRPPWLAAYGPEGEMARYSLRLQVTPDDLLKASTEWGAEVDRYPAGLANRR